ncbi:hypothetical protein [Vibrio coralliilyticus]|uniref:Uncharacterized protein n=1 Tax=Vibrio coralliilyticus TaxID=190893 RepID=A0AAP6ZVQ0_9VIBR|nr:hypothetical protein [Vibrio coralliilyticus]NOI31816.1 hypothetical protein [Vibrio coralliilyticus]NOJ25259.1 hypothetical protein [Vibrio coralliilyticus]
MENIENFYAICKGLVYRGWIAIDTIKGVADCKDNEATPVDLRNFQVIPDKSLDFCHFLSKSLIEIKLHEGKCHLKYLHSGNSQNTGEGSRCMTTLLELCDEYEMTVVLDAYDREQSVSNARRLVDFYNRFGFEFDSDHEDWKDTTLEELTDQDFLYGIPMIRKQQK